MNSDWSSITGFAYWLIPPFFLPIGFLCFRYLPKRTMRWKIYLLFDIGFLFAVTLNISFAFDLFDWIALFYFVFTFAEFFWAFNFFSENTLTKIWSRVGGIIIIGFSLLWLVGGWGFAMGFPRYQYITTFQSENINYNVKEIDYSSALNHVRHYLLSKQLKYFPIFETDEFLFLVTEVDFFSKQEFNWLKKDDKLYLQINNNGVEKEIIITEF